MQNILNNLYSVVYTLLRTKDFTNYRSTEITIIFDYLHPEITTQKYSLSDSDWRFSYEDVGLSSEDEYIVYMFISKCPSTQIKQNDLLDLYLLQSIIYTDSIFYSISHTNRLSGTQYSQNYIYPPMDLQYISEYGKEPFFITDAGTNMLAFFIQDHTDFNIFRNLPNLIAIPSNLFAGCETLPYINLTGFLTYCESLKSIPSKLFEPFKNCEQLVLNDAFSNCTSLTEVPSGLLSNLPISQANSIFQNCTSLQKLPKDLFENMKMINELRLLDLSNAFSGCTNLTDLNDGDMLTRIFEDGKYDYLYFNSTFSGCSNITGKLPELWNIYNDEVDGIQYEGCFTDCINATNYKEAQEAGWA